MFSKHQRRKRSSMVLLGFELWPVGMNIILLEQVSCCHLINTKTNLLHYGHIQSV